VNLIFFIKSATVDIKRYTIKDIPGSSGRLDVISRCVLSAVLNGNKLEKDVQIWVFLDNYGTYVFDSNILDEKNFPKNELLLTDSIVNIIKQYREPENYLETLESVKYSKSNIFHAIKNFIDNKYKVFVLSENGMDFKLAFGELSSKDNLLFIIGDQTGDLLNSKELKKLNLTNISLGDRSFLASSTIRLIKINLQLLV
jgi:tRNA (pseudouridine54-N1)-methyltransferase